MFPVYKKQLTVIAIITLGVTALAIVSAFCYLLFVYITGVAEDGDPAKIILRDLSDYILVILGTIFLQKIFQGK